MTDWKNRKKLGSVVGLGLILGIPGMYYLVFHAPLFLWMPHSPRDIAAFFPSPPVAVAHRGYSSEAPENTLAAFRRAADAGAWVELDVTLCKTGEIIVIHDDTVDRTTDGTGTVAEMTYDELKDLDAGTWFGEAFSGERLPTLEQVFTALPSKTVVLVEMKTGDDKEALPKAVAAAIKKANRSRSVLVISFDPFMLEALKNENKLLLRGQLVGEFTNSDLAWYEKRALQNLAMTGKVQQDVVLFQHTMLDEKLVRRLNSIGYPVLAWTVNEPQDIARMKAIGITGIISNYPNRAR